MQITMTSPRRSPLKFFALVFALSMPIWWIGGATGMQLLPGLPVSALMAFCPMLAALILVQRANGAAAVRTLLRRSFDYERIRAKIWYVPIVLLMPCVVVLAFVWMRATGLPLPAPHFTPLAPPLMFLAFFASALGEELGWSGYVTEPMLARWNALQAGILLGMVWDAWHVVPLLQVHRSTGWIAWHFLYTVAYRVLFVWLYNNTGKSVFAAALFHTVGNLTVFLFPDYGSHYDPRFTAPLVAAVATIVTVVWGPRTLSRRGV